MQTIQIKDFALVKGGKRLPAGFLIQDSKTSHPYFRVTDMKADRVDVAGIKYISDDTYEKIKHYTISSDDIYISIAGTIGLVGRVPAFLSGANLTENAAKITNLNENIINRNYLLYFLRSKQGQFQIRARVGGSTQPKLALNKIYTIQLPRRSIVEQLDVTSVIESYDRLIDNNKKRIKILEKLIQLYYNEWFVKFRFPGYKESKTYNSYTEYGILPEKWEVKKINHACERINYGYTASASLEPVGPKFLRITDIAQDNIDWAKVPFCDLSEKDFEKYKLHEGDIVIARTGATTGFAKRLNKKHPRTIFASYLIRVQVKKAFSSYYLGILIESDRYKKFVKANLSGSAQPQANAQVLTSMPIIIPSNLILSLFDSIVGDYFDEKEILEMRNESLCQLRDLLINSLVGGRRSFKKS